MPAQLVTANTPIIGNKRLQIMGPPGSRKTTVTLQFDRPTLVVELPGEKHTRSVIGIPPPEGMNVLEFDKLDYDSTSLNWRNVWNDIRIQTVRAINGEFGKTETLVFDGTHKAAYACYLAAKQQFASANGDWDGRKGWPWVHDEMLKWFSMVYYSNIPWVIWTVWSAKEQDDQTALANSEAAKKQSIWPDFMGKFQRTCMGETNIVYQYTEGGQEYWQLREDDKVKGIGLRVTPERAKALPYKMKCNWQELKKYITGDK